VYHAITSLIACPEQFKPTTTPDITQAMHMLQVELNTMAASMGSLSTLVSALHRYLLKLHPSSSPTTLPHLPTHNNALSGFARAIAVAHDANCKLHGLPADAVVVVVVQPGDKNAYDQQWLQVELWKQAGVRSVRRTLHDIATLSHSDESNTIRCARLPGVTWDAGDL
jgi:glutathione synthase